MFKGKFRGLKTKFNQPKLYGIPFGFLGALHLKHKLDDNPDAPTPLQIVYTSLPLKYISSLWGKLNSLTVPLILRKPLYTTYASIFNCNLKEIQEDLESFENLGEFFYRKLKPGLRPLESLLISPADGKLTLSGIVKEDRIEQVKGVTYSLHHLMQGQKHGLKMADQLEVYLKNRNNDLYFTVIYLAPGDYHRFHSPTEFKVKSVDVYNGELYSVSPLVVGWLKDVFALNERVVIAGEWMHGFFGMVAVGATNVGHIVVNENVKKGAILNVGEEMGGFKLGSSIVLVFEAPKGLAFVDGLDKLQVGNALLRKDNEEKC